MKSNPDPFDEWIGCGCSGPETEKSAVHDLETLPPIRRVGKSVAEGDGTAGYEVAQRSDPLGHVPTGDAEESGCPGGREVDLYGRVSSKENRTHGPRHEARKEGMVGVAQAVARAELEDVERCGERDLEQKETSPWLHAEASVDSGLIKPHDASNEGTQ